ncbi:uncharacterized protein LOC114013296 isoform X1 [Falco peregrinus]|uniref:uncharacterized protein LOC114013296 isoform X1 n=1 Tax=Falco peregrinus TaxID=8954 RepID=UPI002479AC36|nr:uncharacterized protein LOC114013296 isoform X1 [Falco peregrinus]XP_027648387.2 uncharacterized protein LOC114013296 isoform X1 [Falco peregrinus]XP_055665289.1 uncharacterized protein LOC114013296 isoform X1 [Falco peregrinus]
MLLAGSTGSAPDSVEHPSHQSGETTKAASHCFVRENKLRLLLFSFFTCLYCCYPANLDQQFWTLKPEFSHWLCASYLDASTAKPWRKVTAASGRETRTNAATIPVGLCGTSPERGTEHTAGPACLHTAGEGSVLGENTGLCGVQAPGTAVRARARGDTSPLSSRKSPGSARASCRLGRLLTDSECAAQACRGFQVHPHSSGLCCSTFFPPSRRKTPHVPGALSVPAWSFACCSSTRPARASPGRHRRKATTRRAARSTELHQAQGCLGCPECRDRLTWTGS